MEACPVFEAEVLLRPETPELRFLPECPRALGSNRLSWVAIQHGAAATVGSLNLVDLQQRTNTSYALPGRPGFAFPTTNANVFVVGLERRLCLYDLQSGTCTELAGPVESGVEGTIINDGELFAEGLVFGAKDLKFAEAKAGLYLYRRQDRRLVQLRADQICSNGKVLTASADGSYRLLDIDSPRKTVVEYRLDVARGQLDAGRVVLDLTSEPLFPDGMVSTPDGRSVIIAFYNPQDADFGEARQFDLESGSVQARWLAPGSPQVTCPQLVEVGGRVRLVLTTAVEHMSPERQARHRQAGCLFWAETPWTTAPAPRRFELGSWP